MTSLCIFRLFVFEILIDNLKKLTPNATCSTDQSTSLPWEYLLNDVKCWQMFWKKKTLKTLSTTALSKIYQFIQKVVSK